MRIDKSITYCNGYYTYRNFVTLCDEDLLMILTWRNHPAIRKCMNNTGCIEIQSHLNFCHNLKYRDDVSYWLIYRHEQPIGVLNIIDIDYERKTCEPGFYLSPEVMGCGEAIFVLSNYKDFLFHKLGFCSLVGHNYVENKPALIFTMFFGAKITGVKIINDRRCIESVLTKDSFINGLGTPRLIAKYTKFYREWDLENEIQKYENES